MHRILAIGAACVLALVLCGSATAWSWPADGAVLRPFTLGADAYAAGQHRGIDVAGAEGSPVRAPASGTVTFAGTLPTHGRGVTILTSDGYAVTLVHLGSVSVEKGASIAEGDTLGLMGSSRTPEHDVPTVHLGIRRAAEAEGYVDPLGLLPSRAAVPAPAPPPPATAPAPTPAPAAAPPPATPAPSAPPVPAAPSAPAPGTPPSQPAGMAGAPTQPEASAAATVAVPAPAGGDSSAVPSAATRTPITAPGAAPDAAATRVVGNDRAFVVTNDRRARAGGRPAPATIAGRSAPPVVNATSRSLPGQSQRPGTAARDGRNQSVARGVEADATRGSASAVVRPLRRGEPRDEHPVSPAPVRSDGLGAEEARRRATVVLEPRLTRGVAEARPEPTPRSGRRSPGGEAGPVAGEHGVPLGPLAAAFALGVLAVVGLRRAARRIDRDGAVLPHDADLLRELDPAHRARVHHRGRGRVRAPSASARA